MEEGSFSFFPNSSVFHIKGWNVIAWGNAHKRQEPVLFTKHKCTTHANKLNIGISIPLTCYKILICIVIPVLGTWTLTQDSLEFNW